MARKQLGALLDVATTPQPVVSTETPAAAPRRTAKTRPAPSSEGASWRDYTRIEGRLREDQVNELDALVRKLNRGRGGEGERITKNTLLRVAVDLLLARSQHLQGGTENELTDSVSN